jgi:hypothetical protein
MRKDRGEKTKMTQQNKTAEQIQDEALKTTYPLALKRGIEIGKAQQLADVMKKYEKIIEYGIKRQEGLLENNPILSDFKPEEILELRKEFEELKAKLQEQNHIQTEQSEGDGCLKDNSLSKSDSPPKIK